MKILKKMRSADRPTVFGCILAMTDKEVAENFLVALAFTGHPIEQSDVDRYRDGIKAEMRKWLVGEGYIEEIPEVKP